MKKCGEYDNVLNFRLKLIKFIRYKSHAKNMSLIKYCTLRCCCKNADLIINKYRDREKNYNFVKIYRNFKQIQQYFIQRLY